jgi:hypothetical protein
VLVEVGLRTPHPHAAPSVPINDDADLADYAAGVVVPIGAHTDNGRVGHSFGSQTAPLAAERLPACALVLVAGMIRGSMIPRELPNRLSHVASA